MLLILGLELGELRATSTALLNYAFIVTFLSIDDFLGSLCGLCRNMPNTRYCCLFV